MARTRGPPTRNLVLGPLGPPQALGCYSQSTRLVGFYRFYSRGKWLLLIFYLVLLPLDLMERPKATRNYQQFCVSVFFLCATELH